MKLTRNFSLEEFEASSTASKMGIDNRVPAHLLDNVARTARSLQIIRDRLTEYFEEDITMSISSGYRCKLLNMAVGGSASSAHLSGDAVDVSAKGLTAEELVRFILDIDVEFDQLINEFDRWVHISFADAKRGQVIKAVKNEVGKTLYMRII